MHLRALKKHALCSPRLNTGDRFLNLRSQKEKMGHLLT